MGVKAGNNTNSKHRQHEGHQQRLPKSLEEIDKHFMLWNQSRAKSKTNLKKKSIYPLTVEGAYTRQARQQLKDFGKLYQRKVNQKR